MLTKFGFLASEYSVTKGKSVFLTKKRPVLSEILCLSKKNKKSGIFKCMTKIKKDAWERCQFKWAWRRFVHGSISKTWHRSSGGARKPSRFYTDSSKIQTCSPAPEDLQESQHFLSQPKQLDVRYIYIYIYYLNHTWNIRLCMCVSLPLNKTFLDILLKTSALTCRWRDFSWCRPTECFLNRWHDLETSRMIRRVF